MNQSDHILSITLKQHTPLIHFQHDQDGATLRATELKPALDRYIIEKAFKNDISQAKKYLIDTANQSDILSGLNYKVSINYSNTKVWTFPIEERYPCFFGNMGDGPAKAFSFAEDAIEVQFISFNKELLKTINNNILGFFERKNFGTRQSKGFGSFLVVNQTISRGVNKYWFKANKVDTNQKSNIINNYKRQNPNTTLSDEMIFKTESFKPLFKNIELLWRVIRTGYNDGRINYIKAPLFFYMRDHYKDDVSFQWDKRSIKQTYLKAEIIETQKRNHNFPDILEEIPKPPQLRNNLLVRDLFGLASESKWMSYNNVTVKKEHVKSSDRDEEIQRFKSPVTFKPKWNEKEQKFEVYIILNPIDQKFLDKTFKIFWGRDSKLSLDTPKDFSLSKYFKFLTGEYKEKILDLDTNVIEGRTDSGDLAKVINIFNSFKDFNTLT